MKNGLQERIDELVSKHGSQRAAAAVTRIERSYFYRLATGQKENPSNAVLRKLGLRRIVYYVRREDIK